jgi:hypothetical protein
MVKDLNLENPDNYGSPNLSILNFNKVNKES